MSTFSKAGILSIALLLGICCIHDAYAQRFPRRGQPPQQQQGQNGGQDAQAQEESAPFIHGIIVGIGINTYHGDMDSNPRDNVVKHLGQANLNLLVGADRRMGEFDQWGMGAQLAYDRVSGQQIDDQAFTNNAISLTFTGSYELPIVQQGLFRVFVGAGPTLLFSPTYENFPEFDNLPEDPGTDFEYRELGTRMTGNVVLGVSIHDKVRIGTRIFTTDFLDGHTGLGEEAPFDLLGFFNIGYRFDLKY